MTALVNDRSDIENLNEELPFKPLFTIRRSGRIEVSVYGIVSVISGLSPREGAENRPAFKKLMHAGDTDFALWTRSLLKPWQLLTNFKILKESYPALTDEHFALFMASHSGEAVHLKILEEILSITGVDESYLKCPPANPADHKTRELMKERGEEPRRRYHNCSGKHSGYLAAVKASLGASHMNDYLQESESQHTRLKDILSDMTGRAADSFSATTDGCQLPNYALSLDELSFAYLCLLNPDQLPTQAQSAPIFANHAEIGKLMLKHPLLVSGHNRLDYKIMSRELFSDCPPMVAKEGADGLLGIGMAPSELYPNGLGIAIKLASGFDGHHLELITREILTSLKLTTQASPKTEKKSKPNATEGGSPLAASIRTDHIKTKFHFLNGGGDKK